MKALLEEIAEPESFAQAYMNIVSVRGIDSQVGLPCTSLDRQESFGENFSQHAYATDEAYSPFRFYFMYVCSLPTDFVNSTSPCQG